MSDKPVGQLQQGRPVTLNERDLLALSAEIVTSYLTNNPVEAMSLPNMIAGVHGALSQLGHSGSIGKAEPVPAVAVRGSVKNDHIVCLEDGKKLKLLKRHLSSEHGMTPAQYRAKWKLPADYPMTAPEYSLKRQELASGPNGNFGAIARRYKSVVSSRGRTRS